MAEGRLSVRDEKAPQMVLNEARPIAEVAAAAPVAQAQKLYLKLPGEGGTEDRKTRAILNMFPGELPAVCTLPTAVFAAARAAAAGGYADGAEGASG